VQGNHHDKAPGWTAEVTQRLSINCRMTSLAMNSGYRFESMQSSGMRQIAIQHLIQMITGFLCSGFKTEVQLLALLKNK
jgi:hypothetical protein